jgi:hypothetical protein
MDKYAQLVSHTVKKDKMPEDGVTTALLNVAMTLYIYA